MTHSSIGFPETDPGYGQLLGVLVRRRLWLLGGLLSIMSAAAVYTLLQKPVYQSSMQLLVEPNYESKPGTETEQQFADSTVEIDNSTQLTQMRSSQLMQQAVEQLQATDPDLDAETLQRSLILTQVEEDKVKTKVFQVLYTDNDPQKTQRVLSTIQQVYQDYNREQQKQRLDKGLAFINEQLPLLEGQVRQAEDSLKQFRQQQNLVDPEVQSKALVDSLSQVQQNQQDNNAEIRSLQARYQALQAQLARSPQQALIASRLSQSSRFQGLLNEIQKTELALEQERLRFRDRSPFVQQLLDQRQRQRALLGQEMRRVLGNTARVTQGESLLSQGQLGATDLTLATDLVEAQVNLSALTAKGQGLAEAERSLTGQLRRFPALLAEYGRLEPRVEIGRTTLQQLLKARQDIALEIARGGFDWQVVERPKLGTKIGPSLFRNLLLGAIAGLMLGSVAALVRDSMDDSVHSLDEFKKQVALPLLGIVPALPHEATPAIITLPFYRRSDLVPSPMEMIQWQPFREAMDLIYQTMQLLPAANGLKSLAITSALAGEGKSTLALGLAISAARLNKRVLLIDADLRRPSLHKQLSLPNEQGLSTLLTGELHDTRQSAIQLSHQYSDISIAVMTSGPAPADPVKLLSSGRMQRLIAELERSYDLVILDAPPILGIVDAVLTASFSDGVLLVGRIGQVTRAELAQALTALDRVNVVGVIANGSHDRIRYYPVPESIQVAMSV